MRDLFDVIDPKLADVQSYCGRDYWMWEDTIATPTLAAQGYDRITFHMGERDSFGPLSRKVRAYKDGVCHEFIYG